MAIIAFPNRIPRYNTPLSSSSTTTSTISSPATIRDSNAPITSRRRSDSKQSQQQMSSLSQPIGRGHRQKKASQKALTLTLTPSSPLPTPTIDISDDDPPSKLAKPRRDALKRRRSHGGNKKPTTLTLTPTSSTPPLLGAPSPVPSLSSPRGNSNTNMAMASMGSAGDLDQPTQPSSPASQQAHHGTRSSTTSAPTLSVLSSSLTVSVGGAHKPIEILDSQSQVEVGSPLPPKLPSSSIIASYGTESYGSDGSVHDESQTQRVISPRRRVSPQSVSDVDDDALAVATEAQTSTTMPPPAAVTISPNNTRKTAVTLTPSRNDANTIMKSTDDEVTDSSKKLKVDLTNTNNRNVSASSSSTINTTSMNNNDDDDEDDDQESIMGDLRTNPNTPIPIDDNVSDVEKQVPYILLYDSLKTGRTRTFTQLRDYLSQVSIIITIVLNEW
jgi:hypothetical protein